MKNYSAAFCPYYHRAVEIVGRRWAGAIVRVMLGGAVRFGEIEAAIPDISNRMLSRRLQEFEDEGIVERVVIPTTPVRIEYRLTAKGQALQPAVDALSAWADEWVTLGAVEESAAADGCREVASGSADRLASARLEINPR